MPTYEYACKACGNAWEEIQKITDAPIEVCPKCAQKTAQRMISGGNFILKGGGWYADLYSSTKKDSGGSSGTSSSGSSTSTPSTSSSESSSSTSSTPSTAPASGSGGSTGGSTPAKAS